MIVDIDFKTKNTLIKFKQKDFTTLEDLQSIASMAAGRYCFEAGSAYSVEFIHFANNLVPRVKYILIIGMQEYTHNPIFEFGEYAERKNGDILFTSHEAPNYS